MTDLSGASWVRLTFVDVFGDSHSMQVPASRYENLLAQGQPFDGSTLEGRARSIETDMLLLPDPESLVVTSGGSARVVCTVLTADGSPWAGDPRTALALVLAEVGELGEEYRAGVELEFYLLDDDTPIDRHGYFDDEEGLGLAVVREAAERLEEHGVPIESVHHEAGPGQYEIDIAMLPAMAAADAVLLAKQVVRDVADEAGLRATFMPRVFAEEAGSGMHVHQATSVPLVANDGSLTETGSYFVAGQLAHARALSALASPTVNSYKRLHSGPEAPGAVLWAHTNRGALIRVSSHVSGGTVEFRGADPSANPYLLFAGLIVSAAHGLGANLELPDAVEEVAEGFDPAALDSSRPGLLPLDLDEALDALLADDVLSDAFDPQLVSQLAEGRRAEAAEYRAQVTPWEAERYLDEA